MRSSSRCRPLNGATSGAAPVTTAGGWAGAPAGCSETGSSDASCCSILRSSTFRRGDGSMPSSSSSMRRKRVEDLERLRLPAAPVQRQHQLPAQPLAQRVAAYQPVQLGDQLGVVAEHQLRLDPLLQAGELLLCQPALLEPREGLLELRQRRPSPQLQRFAQRRRGVAGPAVGQRLPTAGVELLEPVEVERVPLELDQVARGPRAQQPGGQQLAQLRDQDLHHLGSGVGDVVAPEVVDQPIDRHHPSGIEQQQRQQRPLLACRQLYGPGLIDRLERPENPKVHPASGKLARRVGRHHIEAGSAARTRRATAETLRVRRVPPSTPQGG